MPSGCEAERSPTFCDPGRDKGFQHTDNAVEIEKGIGEGDPSSECADLLIELSPGVGIRYFDRFGPGREGVPFIFDRTDFYFREFLVPHEMPDEGVRSSLQRLES